MRGILAVAAVAGAALTVAACGSNSGYGSGGGAAPAATQPAASQPVAANITAMPLAPAAVALTATPSAALRATPATSSVERVNGTIDSVNGSAVTLKEGQSFTLTPQTAVTVRSAGTAAALQPGKVVAITAKQQPDNTLLASLVMVFPAAPGGGSGFFGQRPLDGGIL